MGARIRSDRESGASLPTGDGYDSEGSFAKGCLWGLPLSVCLWALIIWGIYVG
jgi:hypothetical protein